MTHYRIKSKLRFTIFLSVVTILLLSMYMGIVGIIDAKGNTVEQFEVVYISSGDSLWSVAKDYTPDDMDIREYVYKVAKFNNIDPGAIQTGDKIKMPIY